MDTSIIPSLIGFKKLIPAGTVALIVFCTAEYVHLSDKLENHEIKITQIQADKKELSEAITRMDKNITAIKVHLKIDDRSE